MCCVSARQDKESNRVFLEFCSSHLPRPFQGIKFVIGALQSRRCNYYEKHRPMPVLAEQISFEGPVPWTNAEVKTLNLCLITNQRCSTLSSCNCTWSNGVSVHVPLQRASLHEVKVVTSRDGATCGPGIQLDHREPVLDLTQNGCEGDCPLTHSELC